MAYDIVQFGDILIPTWLQSGDEQNMGTGEALTSFQQLPNGTYYDNYGSIKSPQGIRPITRAGIISADTAALFVDELDNLRVSLGVRDKLTIRMADGSLRWQWARLKTANTPRPDTAKGLWMPYELQWITAAQKWFKIAHGATAWSIGDDSFRLGDGTHELGEAGTEEPLTATGATTQAITQTNGGNIAATNLAITVTAGTNDITAITVDNDTTGETWTFSGTVTAGNVLLVDCGAMAVTNDAVNAYSDFTPGNRSKWMTLDPGDNTLTVTVTGNGAADGTIAFEYYDHYA